MDISYKDMVCSAKSSGTATEKTMWASIDNLDEMLDIVKKEHSDVYWKFMRKQYGILHGNHYDRVFADYDVSRLSYTGRDGVKKTGPHWTRDEINESSSGMQFPSGTTEDDKYVAMNAAYADFCTKFSDEEIISIAYLFFFSDEDWKSKTKVWDYFCCNQ